MNLLITGGSRGLGLEIVKQQLQAGHHVWVTSRSLSDSLKKLMVDFQNCNFFSCDFSSESMQVRQAIESNLEGVALDAVVLNAAIGNQRLATHLDHAELTQLFQTNVYSPLEVSRFAIRSMLLNRRSGSIVFVSSITTKVGSKGLSFYAATKGAIQAYSKNIAQEWGSRGIRSNCVSPGFLETEMTESLSSTQRLAIAKRSALRQMTQLESVAGTVDFLISPTSNSVTGQNWYVDSGARG